LIVVPTFILYFQFLNSLGNIDTEGKKNNNNKLRLRELFLEHLSHGRLNRSQDVSVSE